MLLLSLLLACDPASDKDTGDTADTGDSAATGPGTLALSFQMDEDYIKSMKADGESPVGEFQGSIYAEADATSLGPVDGATSLQDFAVDIDLSDGGGPTEVAFVTEELEPGIVWILGCLDAGGDGCGDPGDPITIPNENKVEVLAGAETPFTVYMGMLRP